MRDLEELYDIFDNCKNTDIALGLDKLLSITSRHMTGSIDFYFDENGKLESVLYVE